MGNFFSAITKYRITEGKTPEEEQLTEILAEVLRRVPEATIALAGRCGFEVDADAKPHIRTQQPAGGGRRVDVEIRFESQNLSRYLWLELKWNARPDSTQVREYQRFLSDVATSDDRVILLAPWRALARRTKELAELPWHSWTDIGLALVHVAEDASLDEVKRWLVAQFLSYLEEENLSAHQGLEPGHLEVMNGLDSARKRFIALVDGIEQRLDDPWRLTTWWEQRHDREKLRYRRLADGVSEVLGDEAEGRLKLALRLRQTPIQVDPGIPWALEAGFKYTSYTRPAHIQELCQAGLADTASRFVLSGAERPDRWHIVRYLPLTAVVGETLEAQVERLAAFAEETWGVLSARADIS